MATRKKKVRNFNLADLDTVSSSQRGFDVHIKHPLTQEPIVVNDDGAELTMRVIGPDAPEFKEARNEYLKRYLGRTKDKVTNKVVPHDIEHYEEDNYELVVRCVIGWDNLYFDPESGDEVDEPLEFSVENARKVLSACPWIIEQLQTVIGQRANFIKK